MSVMATDIPDLPEALACTPDVPWPTALEPMYTFANGRRLPFVRPKCPDIAWVSDHHIANTMSGRNGALTPIGPFLGAESSIHQHSRNQYRSPALPELTSTGQFQEYLVTPEAGGMPY